MSYRMNRIGKPSQVSRDDDDTSSERSHEFTTTLDMLTNLARRKRQKLVSVRKFLRSFSSAAPPAYDGLAPEEDNMKRISTRKFSSKYS